uniref:Major facilitator superfamily (MFS) profile domain-containing protein n=1 Tax=Panagrolaimus sp. PS1159 TaxID=55785 RepID=A0AC35F3Y8_9BILA
MILQKQEILNVPLKIRSESISTTDNSSCKSGEENGFYYWNSTRYLILIISLICFTLTLSNAIAFNFTIVCVHRDSDKDGTEAVTKVFRNRSNENIADTFVVSKDQVGIVIAAVAAGSIIGSLSLPYASSKLGTRLVFTIYGFISAISTLLSPFALSHSIYLIILMRIGQGIANSIGIPGLGAITSPWAPITESGIFLSLLSTHLQLSAIFTMPMSAFFCETSFGWQGIYYLQGGFTVLAFGAFFVVFRDSPKFHKNVSSKELNEIINGKSLNSNERSKGLKTPYFKILTDKSVIGVIIACIGGAIGFQVFNQYGPIYLSTVLNLNIKKAGIGAAIPYICSLFGKIACGPISDRLTFLSQKTRVIMFASISQYCMALCYILLACMPFKSDTAAQILYTLALTFSGISCVGILKGIALQARQYTYFLLTISAFIHNGVVLIFPFIISAFVQNNNHWSIIFYAVGIVVTISVSIFNFTCEIEPRPWTY